MYFPRARKRSKSLHYHWIWFFHGLTTPVWDFGIWYLRSKHPIEQNKQQGPRVYVYSLPRCYVDLDCRNWSVARHCFPNYTVVQISQACSRFSWSGEWYAYRYDRLTNERARPFYGWMLRLGIELLHRFRL